VADRLETATARRHDDVEQVARAAVETGDRVAVLVADVEVAVRPEGEAVGVVQPGPPGDDADEGAVPPVELEHATGGLVRAGDVQVAVRAESEAARLAQATLALLDEVVEEAAALVVAGDGIAVVRGDVPDEGGHRTSAGGWSKEEGKGHSRPLPLAHL
jgi:hypothetical protein